VKRGKCVDLEAARARALERQKEAMRKLRQAEEVEARTEIEKDDEEESVPDRRAAFEKEGGRSCKA